MQERYQKRPAEKAGRFFRYGPFQLMSAVPRSSLAGASTPSDYSGRATPRLARTGNNDAGRASERSLAGRPDEGQADSEGEVDRRVNHFSTASVPKHLPQKRYDRFEKKKIGRGRG